MWIKLTSLLWLQIGLKGEDEDLPSGSSQWISQPTLPKNQPLTWYKVIYYNILALLRFIKFKAPVMCLSCAFSVHRFKGCNNLINLALRQRVEKYWNKCEVPVKCRHEKCI